MDRKCAVSPYLWLDWVSELNCVRRRHYAAKLLSALDQSSLVNMLCAFLSGLSLKIIMCGM